MGEVARVPRNLFAPRRVFLYLATLLLIGLLFAPTSHDGRLGASLSSYSTSPNGARGLYEVLDRLDFPVQRWLRPLRQPLDANAVYVLLSPPLELTTVEVHRVLEAVRAGAGLVVSPPAGTPLADSLRLAFRFIDFAEVEPDTTEVRARFDFESRTRARFALREPGSDDTTFVRAGRAFDRIFRGIEVNNAYEPVIAGFTLGRGRIIAYADAETFTNGHIRRGPDAVLAVRLLEWLGENQPRRLLWFDEYHHGYGTHASLVRALRRGLFDTPPGRMVVQGAVAVLVLLLALGVRPIRPRPLERIERRSPLEHVDALARAYAAVKADRNSTQLLVRGLRRRHGAGRTRSTDQAWLHTLRERKPELAADVGIVVAALDGTTTADDDAVAALSRIEKGMTT